MGQPQKWRTPGIGEGNISGGKVNNAVNPRKKHTPWNLRKNRIQTTQCNLGRHCLRSNVSKIANHLCHEEGCRDSLPRDITDENPNPIVTQFDKIIEVSSNLV